MRPEADIELEDHHRKVRSLEGQIDKMLRERQYADLQDAYWRIHLHALEARRRLRKLCASR